MVDVVFKSCELNAGRGYCCVAVRLSAHQTAPKWWDYIPPPPLILYRRPEKTMICFVCCRQNGVDECLRVLQVREGATTGDELTRGQPGEPLTIGDKTLLELKPLKAFLPGEVRACAKTSAAVLLAFEFLSLSCTPAGAKSFGSRNYWLVSRQ